MSTPAARLIARGEERPLLLEEVEALLASKALVVDACRHVVRDAAMVVSLATRPVLFALHARWVKPGPQTCRGARSSHAPSEGKHADESHRARLRVEVGRLRVELRTLADVSATKQGFALAPRRAREVVVLAPPSKSSMRRCSPSLPTARRGRAPPWRLRLAPARAPCSGRSRSLRQQARCSRSVAGEHVVG